MKTPRALLCSMFVMGLIGGFATTAGGDQIQCVADGRGNDTCTITYPNVLASSTTYSTVTLAAGDTVTITAGGCSQTGGAGKTWKKYLDPSGSNSDRLYHGLISIPGVTNGLVRLSTVVNNSALPASTGGALTIGYEDDSFEDNGYWSHDDGTEDQCSDVSGPSSGRAWLTLVIHHVSPPFLRQDATYGHCTAAGDRVENCRIDRPDVTHPTEAYRGISFRPGDRVELSAGGCVQTGGSGKTWKKYVDPSGSNSDRLYHGLISIPGVTSGLVRLSTVVGNTALPPSTGGTLTIGYEDDSFEDNGYWSHDDGTEDQCVNTGPAWVGIKITHPPTPAGPHLTLDGMEVSQAIQDLSQSIPLVADKTTWARIYLSTSGTTPVRVAGILRMRTMSGNVSTDVTASAPLQVQPPGSLRARRESWAGSLNFLVPTNITAAGTASFQLISVTDTATGAVLVCNQCSVTRSVNFTAVAPLRARFIGLQYTTGASAAPQAPRAVDFTLLQSWLARAYPVAVVNATNTTVVSRNPWPFTCTMANSQIAAIRSNDISNGTDNRTHYLGLVSNGGGVYLRGCASAPSQPDPSAVGSAPTGNPAGGGPVPINVTGDNDATFGDWYGGHELGHTFGRQHPGFCNENSKDDPSFPNPNGQISDNLGTDTGLDIGNPAPAIPLTLLPGAARFDIMTYCNQPQWLSAYTYAGIGTRLAKESSPRPGDGPPSGTGSSQGSTPPGAPARLVDGQFIHVVATVDLTAGTGQILYVLPVERSVSQTLSGETAEIRAFTRTGQLLTTVAADLRRQTDRAPGDPDRALIDVSVPFNDAIVRLELALQSKTIDTFTSSARQPAAVSSAQIAKVSPGKDPALAGNEFALRWSPSRPSGDPITYIVETSSDHSHWDTIGIGLINPLLGLTPEQARSRWIRITATNGFRKSRSVELQGIQ